ncbi:carboxylesterase family protein [Arthrobacter gengyunqii]|uniref:Carboxylic ester hydrolase n=1 Tax=Arthrobacter gengyunqii TaxID=2886940 RepID=A0ABS8GJ87_9MICC|nr:carboxylesterase family protein [Arthrobacter gengyunqii]MCC3266042.1 carboxylesterase family protein [Arthrobacter gengyunqii]
MMGSSHTAPAVTAPAAYKSQVRDGVVHTRGVRYGKRADPADRFSALIGPDPADPQGIPAAFPQNSGSMDWLLGPALARLPRDEDAFQVNIWAPVGARNAPVLVFLPGGAYISGAGTADWYDGQRLCGQGGMVVITVNYRLGAAGLMGADGVENRVLDDVLQALRWIQDNVAAFGGNPDDVTLAGQSAGAWLAFALACAEPARGLFRRAAFFSLPFQPPLTASAAGQRAEIFNGALAADPATAGVDQVLAAQREVERAYAGRGLGLQPAADGVLVPADLADFSVAAERLHVESILLSATQDEAAAMLRGLPVPAVSPEMAAGFIAERFQDPQAVEAFIDGRIPGATHHARMVEAMSLYEFRLAATELAAAASAAGVPATLVRFAVPSPLDGIGSPHNFDLPFLFGNREDWSDAPMLDGFDPAGFEAVSAELRAVLLGFASGGVARRPDGTAVPAYDPALPQMLRLSAAEAELVGPEKLFPRR